MLLGETYAMMTVVSGIANEMYCFFDDFSLINVYIIMGFTFIAPLP